jgi:Tol biopolymer transport system component/DNA-binding winged helix-turn-helix (wHTH) protein
LVQPLKVFRFGDFALDCAQRRLLRGAQDLYLPPKTFELLLYLIQNSGRIIAKGELLDAIWSGVNVNENTLAQRIREVREALHDGENGVSFIKTIPRVGYQFVAQVTEESQRLTHPNLRGRFRETPRTLSRYAVGFAVIGVAAVIAALALSRANAPMLLDDHRLVSGFPASFREPSLSPDGGTIAFVEDVDGRRQVWLKSLSGGGATQLTFLNDGAGPARTHWSTGDEILFNYAGGIWAVSPLGGAPRQIIQRGRNPSVSADGRRLVYEGLGVPDGDRGIWTAAADGTNARRVLDKAYSLAGEPAVSPDGRSIVFFQSEGGPMGDFWVVPTAGGPARRLTFDDAEAGTPTWTPDGRFIIFSSERAGSRALWRIPVAGGQPEPVTSGAGEDRDPQISADGRRLIYTNLRNTFSLELLDPRSGRRQTLVQSRTLVSGPRFSPDGERVTFFQKTPAGVHVFTIARNGKDLRQVTSREGERNIVPRWSGEGASLLFAQVRPTDSFRKVAASGGESLEILPWAWDTKVELDPHERALVFVRDRHVIIRHMHNGREITLDRSVDFPRWSPDGQTIFGTETVGHESFNTWNVVRCEVASRSCSTLTSGHSVVPSPDGQRIYFMRPAPRGMRSVWSADVDGRDERALGEIGPFRLPDIMLDVSRDGVIVWPAFHAGKPEIWTATLHEASTTR